MECYAALKIRKKIPYDSTHRRSLEESKSQRQEVEWWVPGAGGGEEGGINRHRAFVGDDE